MRRADGSVATGWVLMPLRLFLGVTFLFAGLQKLANPNFFRDASPSSIHAQLAGAARSSPVHAFVGHLVSIAPLVGAVIALGEVAIGLGVLVGLFTRIAAVAGLVLSFGLFLTVSFHSSPYFTGSDIVFVFAWTPFVLAGAGGAPALDTLIAEQEAAAAVRQRGMPRRDVLSRGVLAGVGAVIVVATGGLVAMIGRLVGGAPPPAGGSNTLSGAPSATTAPTTTAPGGSTPTTGAAPSGTAVGPASSVPVGGAASFTDPASGDPALVVQLTSGKYHAFDAVCPHAGCTVAYMSSGQVIACPCHGSEFDPTTGNVLRGPAANGLTSIKIAEGPNGDLYVQ